MARGAHQGKFVHLPPGAKARLIEQPNSYREFSLKERTVILKNRGAVDREDPEQDSYVITEDHYIEFLAQTDIANIIPVEADGRDERSHFLFLGYSSATGTYA